jgi:hypothetical protein
MHEGRFIATKVCPVSELEEDKELPRDIRVRAEDRLERLEAAEARREAAEKALKEAAEVIEYADGQLRGGSAVGRIPQENAARAYRKLDAFIEAAANPNEQEETTK